MRTGELTLAEVLRDNGYKTGCFGKWHNGGYYLQHPNRQGFDEFTGFCVGHLGYYFDAWYLHNDDPVKSKGYASDFFTGLALDFIERNRNNPFFCYVPYNVPHSPFQVPEKYFNKYISTGLDSTLSSVYGMVENMDDNIELILKKLDELKLTENTIVIFFSDNGPNTDRYNGGMKGKKGSVDEGGMKVPFYITWPAEIKAGSTSQLAQDIDIMPTLLSLCGIEFKQVNPLDGIDLSGIITGKTKPFDRYIYSRQGNQPVAGCNSSIRNNRFRLVLSRSDTLLFDMVNDPGQKKNIYHKETGTAGPMLTELLKLNSELVSGYKPVTTIEAGFPDEKSFVLPVQDALLSGSVKYSSIHPNQSYTRQWITDGDSVYWTLNINRKGKYRVEMQYGCPEGETGSKMSVTSASGSVVFTIDQPFNSEVLPDRDYVKRSESVERTWKWMDIGELTLEAGNERIVLKLISKEKNEAGIIKAIRFVRL
jgi:arylsulfatase A